MAIGEAGGGQPPRQGRGSAFGLWSIAVLAAVSAVVVWHRDGPEAVARIIEHDLVLVIDVAPKVAAGCLIAAFVTRLIPRSMVARWVGEGSGTAGLAIAYLAGLLVPGGPFTAYPLALGVLVAGADLGAVIAFITSWLLLGVTRVVVWELGFFAPEVIGFRLLVCLPLPLIAGALARTPFVTRLARRLGP
jgi:uncharacterized membrane protein YraQ (UPF0718 family)